MTRTSTGESVTLDSSERLKLLGGLLFTVAVSVASVVGCAYSMHYEAVASIRVLESRVKSLEYTVDRLTNKLDTLRGQ